LQSSYPTWGEGITRSLRGDGRSALGPLTEAAQRFATNGYWLSARLALADLSEAALDLGEQSLVAQAHDWAADDPYAAQSATQHAMAALTVGCERLAAGDHKRAGAVLEGAAVAFEAAGWSLYEGRARALLATALAPTDLLAASASLGVAVTLFGDCGAIVRRERARHALEQLGPARARAPRPVTGLDALTKREREVAALAAQGFSAREIGERLFIGERTVETHLGKAYGKLGISSRVELVRLAPSLGL